jgi:general secretion pathway protein G
MWAIHRAPDGRRDCAGFTLLEILVVLAILALVAAATLPALGRIYDRVAWRFYRVDVERQIAGLRLKAYLDARDLALVSQPAEPGADAPPGERIALQLPAGWRVVVRQPIIYRADGICLGGRLDLIGGSVRATYVLAAPRCWPPDAADDG